MFNNKTRTFLLLTITFIALIGLSAATAADIDNNATDIPVSADDAIADSVSVGDSVPTTDVSTKDVQLVKKTADNLKSEGEATFTDLATDIADSDVTLAKDYVQGDSESAIVISEDKVIDGKGHTITATKGIFNISSGVTFTLKNTIIFSEYGPSYQTYYYDLYNKGNLIVDNVSFTYTKAWGERTYGYPIYMDADSTVDVKDSTFSGYDTNGALIYGYGARINVNVDNSVFDNYNTGNAAIYMRATGSNLTLTNSNFTNAGATEGSGINYGGALYLNNINQIAVIDNCIFENITSSYRGGAMYVSGPTNVTNSKFKNLAQSRETYNGGAIWVNSNSGLYLQNNVMEDITSNSADIYFNNGYLLSNLTVVSEDVTLDQEASGQIVFDICDDMGNSIDFRTAAFSVTIDEEEYDLVCANGTATLDIEASMDPGVYPVTFNYDATKVQGDVTVPEITFTVKDIGLFKYVNVTNAIDSARVGSTVVIDSPIVRGSSEDSVVIDKTVTIDFNGNTINAKSGKVFDIKDGANVVIKNVVITNVGNPNANLYNSEGRIANITGKNTALTFENVTFENNNAPNYGSSAYGSFVLVYNESIFNLKDSTITNCTGTFINIVDGTVTVDNTVFDNNDLRQSYSLSWNALIANGGNLEVKNSAFTNNRVNIALIRGQSNTLPSSAYGNYITIFNYPLYIENTLFENNTATSGRGTAVNTNNDTTIKNSTFIYNTQASSNEGGAVLSEQGDLEIDSCIFVNNSARYSVSSWSGTVTVTEGTAIANNEGNLNIKNSIIMSNITEASAVYNKATDADVVANGNYWGSNNPEGLYASSSSADEITVDNWVILGIDVTPTENVNFKDNVTVTAGLTKITDGETETALTESLPAYGSVVFTAKGADVADEEVEIVDGVATTTVNVNYNPYTVTAQYPNAVAEYTGEVVMPEPLDITLNDGNWTSYFNEDGTLSDIVVPDSVLKFNGTFLNRDMVIDIPVTITTADEQAILNNCTILVKADNVVIKDITMNNVDYADVLIEAIDASDLTIENNDLTITNNEEKTITRAINVEGGENVVIRNNNITTVGPEEDIVYTGEDMGIIGTLYTASISSNTNGIIIDSNKITTKKNDNKASDLGTIYGIYLYGDREAHATGIQVTNNEITTDGEVYIYGLTANYIDAGLIENNTIATTGTQYANGLQICSCDGTAVQNNKVTATAEEFAYGILDNGMLNWETYDLYLAENNIVTNNVVDVKADNAQGIQIFFGESNAVTYNNITVDADNGVGIGVADASYGDISFNNIEVTSAMEKPAGVGDAISFYPAGVKVQTSSMAMHSANYNAIAFNHIIVDAPVANVAAVNVTVRSEISENYLVSPKGVGDAGVVNTASYGTTIEDNIPLVYVITDTTYVNFFDEDGVFNTTKAENGSYLNVSGEINNKDFIFDNVELNLINDGTAVLNNATIISQNGAKVSFDGIVVKNEGKEGDYTILFETEGNTIKNSEITVTTAQATHVIEITGDNNKIIDTTITATIPSADVVYDKNWVGHPASSALYVSSNNNVIEGATVTVDGSAVAEGSYYASIDGIDIQSEGSGIISEGNQIIDTTVSVTGPNYVYGINVGRAKDTKVENAQVNVESDYYTNGIQLFDGDNTIITDGKITSTAGYEAYGIYSTAMGTGISKGTSITNMDITVDAPVATGILIEGANSTVIADSTFTISGENASAIKSYVDWMGNEPSGFEATGNTINIDTTGDKPVIYFGLAHDVVLTDNTIKSNGGSEILFNSTTNGQVTDNYIMIKDTIIGNHAVKTTEDDTVIEDNTPVNEAYEELLELLEQYKTTTVVIDDIDAVSYGDSVKITGKVTDGKGNYIPDQVVTITVNDADPVEVTTTNGVFEYETTAAMIGTNNVTVNFAESEDYYASEANATFEVNKKKPRFYFYAINDTIEGSTYKITGKIPGGPDAIGTSTITLNINGEDVTVTLNDDGYFKYTATAVAGVNNITATYDGSDVYAPAVIKTKVNAKTNVRLYFYTIKDTEEGSTYKITGKLLGGSKGIAGATITLNINGENVTVTTANDGYFKYTATAVAGVNNITATYEGSDVYVQAVNKTKVNAKAKVRFYFYAINDTVEGSTYKITGKIPGGPDAIGTSTITLNINGEDITITLNSDGYFKYTTTAVAGINNITATYAGSDVYAPAVIKTTVYAEPLE